LKVSSVESAIEAIRRITEDGEGTSLANISDAITSEESHFHGFLEFYIGLKLLSVDERAPVNQKQEFIY
jgi:hypothetical protein